MELIDNVKSLLTVYFSIKQKQTIRMHNGYIRFSCPYCGDSEDVNKKRATIYFHNYSFHCFNCNKHTNAILFLKDFNAKLPSNYEEYLEIINKNTRKRSIDYCDYSTYYDYAIDIEEYAKILGWITNESHSFIHNRHLKHVYDKIYFNRAGFPIFINYIGDRMIGYQVRDGEGDNKYKKINIERMYELLGKEIVKNETFSNLIELSHIYNFFQVNFNATITLFEGIIDSYFYPNAIATSTINSTFYKNMEGLDIQFFYDNDNKGKEKMRKLLHDGHRVFLWGKFIDEYSLHNEKIKDLNDLVIYCKKTKSECYKYLKLYFSNNTLDSIYL